MRTFFVFLTIAIIAILFSGCAKKIGDGEVALEEKTEKKTDLVVKGEALTEEAYQEEKSAMVAKFKEAKISSEEEKQMTADDVDALIDVINIEVKKGKTFQNVSTFEDIVNQL